LGGDEDASRVAIDLVTYLTMRDIVHRLDDLPSFPGESVWSESLHDVANTCAERIRQLSVTNISTCLDAFDLRLIGFTEVLQLHGLDAMFCERHSSIEKSLTKVSIAYGMLHLYITDYESLFESRNVRKMMTYFGKLIEETTSPYFSANSITTNTDYRFVNPKMSGGDQVLDYPKLNNRERFGAFVILATMAEGLATPKKREPRNANILRWLKQFGASHSPWALDFIPILTARFSKDSSEEKKGMVLDRELDKCNLSKSQRQIVRSWVKREISFVGQPKVND